MPYHFNQGRKLAVLLHITIVYKILSYIQMSYILPKYKRCFFNRQKINKSDNAGAFAE